MEGAIAKSRRHILLTGPPGIGKTTLVKKVCELLRAKGIRVNGFYTEEVRYNGKRIGFDVVTLEGKRQILARIGSSGDTAEKKCMVGQYSVSLNSFESAALPVLQIQHCDKGVLIIDEIGRMELFSKPFQKAVQNAFGCTSNVILATVPVPKARPMPFVDTLRQRSDVTLITVDQQKRNSLAEEILHMLSQSLNTG